MLSLHYDKTNRILFVNDARRYQFKAKGSDKKPHILCLGNIAKDFTTNNMRKSRLKGVVKVFSVDCSAVDTNNILDIRRYLMKET